MRLFDIFRNVSTRTLEDLELASDGNILDICYSEKNNNFGYASTDTMCYIRKFSTSGSEMLLENVLQGHKSEVNCIKWDSSNNTWITGGEDSTIRLWVLIFC
jgi:WD40 repeat protein